MMQGIVDYDTAIALESLARPEFHCQIVAKWQQAVEKLVKSLVAGLDEAKLSGIKIGFGHDAMPYVAAMLRGPGSKSYLAVRRRLSALMDQRTRNGIRALDQLAPRRPAPGNVPGRNTEYPFLSVAGEWLAGLVLVC